MDRRVHRFGLGMPWEDSHGYAQAVRVGNSIHVAGQIPHDTTGSLVGIGDAAAQVRAALSNLDRVLEGLGATKRQVVEDTIMVVGLAQHFGAVSEAHRAYFDGHRPASTVFGVVELAFPGQLIEIAAEVSLDLPK